MHKCLVLLLIGMGSVLWGSQLSFRTLPIPVWFYGLISEMEQFFIN